MEVGEGSKHTWGRIMTRDLKILELDDNNARDRLTWRCAITKPDSSECSD